MRAATDKEKFETIIQHWNPTHHAHGLASEVGQDGPRMMAVCRCGVGLAIGIVIWMDVAVWIGEPVDCPICHRRDPHYHEPSGTPAPERP